MSPNNIKTLKTVKLPTQLQVELYRWYRCSDYSELIVVQGYRNH